ncbi:MAG: YlxR family protein [Eubacterium sp.]|nr:YlxR family protein [Eubacterium sp.]
MEKKKPLRKCIGCNEMKEKSALIRIIRTAEGNILLDKTGRMNGRGAYICHSEECMKKAKKNNSLSKAFGMKVSDEIYDELTAELR